MEPIFKWDDDDTLVYTGKLPETTKRAFEITLRKYKIIRKKVEYGHTHFWTGGVATCGFCMLYYVDFCNGCPVFLQTGQRYCEGSVYAYFKSTLIKYFNYEATKEEALEAIDKVIIYAKSVYKEAHGSK